MRGDYGSSSSPSNTLFPQPEMCPHRCSAGTSSSRLLKPESLMPVSPNPALSDNLCRKGRHQKPISEFLVARAAPSLQLPVAQALPKYLPKPSSFCPYLKAQAQLVADMTLPLVYRLCKLPALVRLCAFFGLHLWD